jgi:hypothetical protein
MSDKPFATAQRWIDLHHKAGAKHIGASCNPIRREVYLLADDKRLTLNCNTQRETRILKDILHDYIGRLPRAVR